ncbi:MAG: hypothetical protein ACT4P6_03135 [Gemmatimonadaceae bacterium]
MLKTFHWFRGEEFSMIPERALRNLLDRGRLFTDMIREETDRLDLPAIETDNTMSAEHLAKRVAAVFGL